MAAGRGVMTPLYNVFAYTYPNTTFVPLMTGQVSLFYRTDILPQVPSTFYDSEHLNDQKCSLMIIGGLFPTMNHEIAR